MGLILIEPFKLIKKSFKIGYHWDPNKDYSTRLIGPIEFTFLSKYRDNKISFKIKDIKHKYLLDDLFNLFSNDHPEGFTDILPSDLKFEDNFTLILNINNRNYNDVMYFWFDFSYFVWFE